MECTVNVNFQHDFANILRDEMLNYNITIDDSITDRDVNLKFFNFKKRQVEPRVRNILTASEFICPPDMQHGLELIESKLSSGLDISMHLSRQLYNLDYHDSLLNDWGIYHLHLGTTIEPDGFIQRTGPLLFARFDNDNAYLINIMSHGSWTDQDILRVLHNNWPDSISQYRMDALGLVHVPTNADIKLARKHGVVMLTEIEPGVVYYPMGGGVTSAKTSIEVTRQALYYHRLINQLQEYTLSKEEEIRAILKDKYDYTSTEIDLNLVIGDNIYYAKEPTTNAMFQIGRN